MVVYWHCPFPNECFSRHLINKTTCYLLSGSGESSSSSSDLMVEIEKERNFGWELPGGWSSGVTLRGLLTASFQSQPFYSARWLVREIIYISPTRRTQHVICSVAHHPSIRPERDKWISFPLFQVKREKVESHSLLVSSSSAAACLGLFYIFSCSGEELQLQHVLGAIKIQLPRFKRIGNIYLLRGCDSYRFESFWELSSNYWFSSIPLSVSVCSANEELGK